VFPRIIFIATFVVCLLLVGVIKYVVYVKLTTTCCGGWLDLIHWEQPSRLMTFSKFMG
jgi:hypothetical protein